MGFDKCGTAGVGVGAAPAEGVQTLTQHHGLTGRQHRVAHGALSGLRVQHQAPLIQLDMLQVVPLLLLLLPLGTWAGPRGQSRLGVVKQEAGESWGWKQGAQPSKKSWPAGGEAKRQWARMGLQDGQGYARAIAVGKERSRSE